MARKRYETAFITSSSTTAQLSSQYPDVDSLLLSIDVMALADASDQRRHRRSNQRHHRWRSKSLIPFDHRLSQGPSISTLCLPPSDHLQPTAPSIDTTVVGLAHAKHQGSSSPSSSYKTIENCSRVKDYCDSHHVIPSSEPLRPKPFFLKSSVSIQSSSGCSTTNSSSPLPKLERKGKPGAISRLQPKPNAQSLLKNSASSLDSVESSERIQEDSRYLDTKHPPISQLLSPISDKSPIETDPEVKVAEVNTFMSAAAEQLTNLPWEMPKLRRKLALLVDSGISLDAGSGSRDVERWPGITKGKGQTQMASNNLDRQLAPGQVTHTVSDSPPTTKLPPIPQPLMLKPDRCKMKLDFGNGSNTRGHSEVIKVNIPLEEQDWFHGSITRIEAEDILRTTKAGSFLVRNCESSIYNRFSLSLKSSRGFIHARIEPNVESGRVSFSADAATKSFDAIPSLVLHYMSTRLSIRGAEHVLLKYPVLTSLL